ncbi:hypothetical protein SUGI_0663080 [Cryptomeria japonica]|nr:hypothetical protein SUGI_0663080 [Cryptomeria japonica]
MSSHKENQFPFAFDAKLNKAFTVAMKAKVDEMYEEWKSEKEGLSKKAQDANLVKTPHYSHSLPCSLGDSHKQSQSAGLRLLTKMGYKGKGLGIHGQCIVEPVKVEARTCYARLGYGEGEFSKAVDANNSLKEEQSQAQSERGNGTSPLGNGDTCKMSKRRMDIDSSQHACTKGDHQRAKKKAHVCEKSLFAHVCKGGKEGDLKHKNEVVSCKPNYHVFQGSSAPQHEDLSWDPNKRITSIVS